jgi:hypothetical protein
MTRQTDQPLLDYQLNTSSRSARDLARHMVPQMDLDPPYQRGAVWTLDQRIGLVKSWITGVPIPAVILNNRDNYGWTRTYGAPVYKQHPGQIWAVVDGKQRIETAVAWFTNELAVPASWFDRLDVARTADTEDGPYACYDMLTVRTQRMMGLHIQLPVIEAKLPSVQAEAELYLLVNGGGTGQTPEDMARAAEIANT